MTLGFLGQEMNIFFIARVSFPIYKVSPKRRSIHGGGRKQDVRMGNIFGKMGDTGGIIQGDNSAGNCFVIRDSIPMNFFK